MQRKVNRRFTVLSAAIGAVGLMGASIAQAQNIVINDPFDDGNLATNTGGAPRVGNGFTLANAGGTETGGAFRVDTSALGGFSLQGANSVDRFDFWNAGGATVQWTTNNVAVNTYHTGSHGPFIGGPGSDWRHELGIISHRRTNGEGSNNELFHNTAGGLYVDLFYNDADEAGPGGLTVSGNLRVVNKTHQPATDAEGSAGIKTVATFTFDSYNGVGDLVSALNVNDTGFSLNFDQNVQWTIQPTVGSGVVASGNTLSGGYADLNAFGDFAITDEFINDFGGDAFVWAAGQNVASGQGSGDVSAIVVDAFELAEPPPPTDTFWIAASPGNWSTAANWDGGEPVPVNNAVLDNNGTITVDQPSEVANYLDVGSDRGLTPPIDATGRGGTINVGAGAELTVNNAIRLGQARNGSGTMNVSGGTVNVPLGADADIYVGDNGNGVLNISGGTVTVGDEVFLGIQPGSTGALTVSGDGTLTITTRNLLVGFAGEDIPGGRAGAVGTLELRENGTINTGFLFSGFFRGANSTITMTGGTMNVRNAVVMAREGNSTFNHSGGTIDIPTGPGDFVVSDFGIGDYNISGTAALNVSREFVLSQFNGSEGTVNQSGGTINIAGQLVVGREQLGTFNQTGGSMTTARAFLGDFDDSNGIYRISGGTLTTTGSFSVGGALASNAPPDDIREEPTGSNGPQGQALQARGTFIVSGSGATINIGTHLLANPADKAAIRNEPGQENVATLGFEIGDSSGTSLINIAQTADIDGAVIDIDLTGGFTPAPTQVFNLAHAASFGSTGTGTTQNVGVGMNATLAAEDAGQFTVAILPDATGQMLQASSGTIQVANIRGSGAAVIGGTVQVLPNGGVDGTSKIGIGLIQPGGKLDLSDNKLIVSAPGAIGTWDGTAYTGVAGLIAAGRGSAGGNAQWNGTTGITTSDVRAIDSSNRTSLGVIDASDKFRLPGGEPIAETDTALFSGQTVLGSDMLVMFTWGGDANLDGKINIDDYGRIDSNVGTPGANGWANGDFNYDGKINIDDYGIIDSNISQQGGLVFSTGGDAGGMTASSAAGGVSAVPEPASMAVLGLAGAAALGARRRRRRC